MGKNIVVLCVIAGVLALCGCGGDSSAPAGRTTTVKYAITWAQRSRATGGPASALSAVLILTGAKADGSDLVDTVDRLDDPASFTQTYTTSGAAVIGTHAATLKFFSQKAGAGSLVASTSKQVTVNSDGTGAGDFIVGPTNVVTVTVLPNQHVFVGQTADLAFSAFDSSGSALALTPGSAIFAIVTGGDQMTLTPGGQAAGVTAGAATVTATVDGHVSATQSVSVLAAPTTFIATGAVNTAASIAAFKTAIGGADNSTATGPKTSGFRTINWDGVKLDGTDFGGASTTIVAGKTIIIPATRFQARGVKFGTTPVAVSGDGFVSVNPNATGHFPAFSTANTFAPVGSNQYTLNFVTPSNPATTPTPTANGVRGFGAVFLDVNTANTSFIEFFSGNVSFGKFSAPVSTAPGQPCFVGVLFNNPAITSVVITTGTTAVFSTTGAPFTPGSAENLPSTDLAVLDDFIYSEPATP